MNKLFLYALAIALTLSACKKDKDPKPNGPGDTACESNHEPVIFLHGFLASGDTWANQVMRFTSNGYCANLLYAYDWNSVGSGNDVAALDKFVDSVLTVTGATKVNIVGHSAGGGYGYSYCNDAARAAKVAHYVHVGSSSQSSPAGPNDEVPTLCISSPDDATTGASTVTGATNISIAGKDHYEIATSAETFAEMYKFFNGGKAPTSTTIKEVGAEVNVSGKALTLGENNPHNGATINIYEVNATTAERTSSTPQFTLTAKSKGTWGPQKVKANTTYEFEVISGKANDRVVHYFREGFVHHNPLVYLRTIPPASSLAGTLLAGLPKNDNQTVMAVFTASQATVAGRDELTVDATTLSTTAITPGSATVIAMFLYDDNNNQQTDLTKPTLFNFLNQFLTARDMFFQTSTPNAIPLRFNGRNLAVRNLKSNSEGVVVAVFD